MMLNKQVFTDSPYNNIIFTLENNITICDFVCGKLSLNRVNIGHVFNLFFIFHCDYNHKRNSYRCNVSVREK